MSPDASKEPNSSDPVHLMAKSWNQKTTQQWAWAQTTHEYSKHWISSQATAKPHQAAVETKSVAVNCTQWTSNDWKLFVSGLGPCWWLANTHSSAQTSRKTMQHMQLRSFVQNELIWCLRLGSTNGAECNSCKVAWRMSCQGQTRSLVMGLR